MANAKLTEEQSAQVNAWVKEHWKDANCPFCKSPKWTLSDSIYYVPTVDSATPKVKLNLGGSVLPFVCLISDPCGYIVTLSAVRVGLMAAKDGPGGDDV